MEDKQPRLDVKTVIGGILSVTLIVLLSGLTPTASKKAFYNWTAFFIAAGDTVILFLCAFMLKFYERRNDLQKKWVAEYIGTALMMPMFTGYWRSIFSTPANGIGVGWFRWR